MTPVTVVIPAFNSERYIGEALDSVKAQTMREVEVVVVDDGSKDSTLAVVETFSRDLDIRVIRQANSGPAAARNAGVRAARTPYCAFLDSDDKMLHTRLAEQAALLDRATDCGLVHSDLMTFDERGVVHKSRTAFSDPRGGAVLDHLLLDNFITTSTVMARVDALTQAGLFRVGRHVSEDFELWLRMAERWPVGYIGHPLVMYRYTPGSLSGNKLTTAMAALEVVEEFWAQHPDYRASRAVLYRRSLARHLSAAGWAASRSGRRGIAMRYLAAALVRDPADTRSWKGLVRALLVPLKAVPRQAA